MTAAARWCCPPKPAAWPTRGACGRQAPRRANPASPLLRTALLAAGTGDGWGNTNATTAACRRSPPAGQQARPSPPVAITLPDRTATGTIGAATPLLSAKTDAAPAPIHVENHGTTPLATLVDTSFTAPEPGATAPATCKTASS